MARFGCPLFPLLGPWFPAEGFLRLVSTPLCGQSFPLRFSRETETRYRCQRACSLLIGCHAGYRYPPVSVVHLCLREWFWRSRLQASIVSCGSVRPGSSAVPMRVRVAVLLYL